MSKRWLAPITLALLCKGATRGDRVIGHVTQRGGGASESRIILLRIDDGLVQEYWSWAAQPGVPRPLGFPAAAARQTTVSAN